MKNRILIIIFIFIFALVNSQTIIPNDSNYTVMDAPLNSYIKDVNNTFAPFLGTWQYQNGNEILIVKLEKVAQYYYPEFDNYKDFIKGNYSYTIDGGITYIVNTIDQNININEALENAIYSPQPTSNDLLEATFRDEIYQKNCDATFTFLQGSSTELTMQLRNRFRGYIAPETPPNPSFCIPNNVVLVKQ